MNKHEPAFPIHDNQAHDCQGLTKYEEVAARFMAALLSNSEMCKLWGENPEDGFWEYMMPEAFLAADAFFAELEKRGAK